MKKLIALLLALLMAAALLTACGGNASDTTGETTQAPAETAGPASAVEALEKIWNLYAEEEKFAIFGGNMEAGVMGAPAAYDLAYAENMTYNLLIPQDQIGNVTEVASMIHAMNANTFTGAAFKLADGVDAAAFAGAMKEAVLGNMWMCGFPEQLIITNVGGGIVTVAFGVDDVMTVYAGHLASAWPQAETLVDEPII